MRLRTILVAIHLVILALPLGGIAWLRLYESALVRQTARMWLTYAGLTPDDLRAIHAPVLVLAGDRDELVPFVLTVSLYRTLPDAELAVCPRADHAGPTPERARVFASLIRDFASRYTQT